MLEIYPEQHMGSAPSRKKPRRTSGFFRELGKFMLLFAFFFAITGLVIMWPTVYSRYSYLLDSNKINDRYKLPSVSYDDKDQYALGINIPKEDRLIIPKIGVDAPLVYPQSANNNVILEAIKEGVAQYPGTAEPGKIGNTFLTGHSSFYWWSGGKYNEVFANLDKLENGDLAYVFKGGNQFVYKVSAKKVVVPKDVSVLDATDTPVLTLMTCTPLGTNLKRLIVTADLVSAPKDLADFGNTEEIPSLPRFLPLT